MNNIILEKRNEEKSENKNQGVKNRSLNKISIINLK